MTSNAALKTPELKDAAREQWDKFAKGWNDQSTRIRGWLRVPTDAMLEMAEVGPGARVLDVAAGAGGQTLDIARRIGPAGSVLATDLSPRILEFAKENARRAGYRNVETQVADGEDLQVPEASFDAAVCRLGLMLFADPPKGLREIYRALRPGGRGCTMVFSAPETNPCIAILVSTALKHAGLPPRDPYQSGGLLSLGKPMLIDDLFNQAGFIRWRPPRLPHPSACRRWWTISILCVRRRVQSCRSLAELTMPQGMWPGPRSKRSCAHSMHRSGGKARTSCC
jgi:ubiquinone/menaquinone biosynthesis C-methylase UbiE